MAHPSPTSAANSVDAQLEALVDSLLRRTRLVVAQQREVISVECRAVKADMSAFEVLVKRKHADLVRDTDNYAKIAASSADDAETYMDKLEEACGGDVKDLIEQVSEHTKLRTLPPACH